MVKGIRSYEEKERRKVRRRNREDFDVKPPRSKPRRVDYSDKDDKYDIVKRYNEGQYDND